LKILIDYRPALRQRTGTGEYVYQLVRALTTEIGLSAPEGDIPLSSKTGTPTDNTVKLFSSSWRDRLKHNEITGLTTIDKRVPVSLLNLLWHRFEWPPIELLTGERFDVVHSAHPMMLPSNNAASVITIHDLYFFLHPEHTQAEIRRDYSALIRSHAERADTILVPSEYTAQEVKRLLDIPTTRISICPHGAPSWPARENWPDEGHILFLGTLEPRKNIGTLLKSYSSLLKQRRDIPHLVLGGSATPSAKSWLESLKRPPLLNHAQHIGYVPEHDRHTLYKNAKLLVLPSFDEGFGLPVLEAMTVGVPVVAANRGALPSLLGDAGLLVNPSDDTELTAAMERMLFDKDLIQKSVSRGHELARQYTWSAAAKASLSAYTQAIDNQKTRSIASP